MSRFCLAICCCGPIVDRFDAELRAQTVTRDDSVEQMIDRVQQKMVKVFGAKIGNVEGYSTGILISADGQILTSQGVYLDGNLIRVLLADGSEHRATVLRRDRTRQLALLKIEASTPDYFSLDLDSQGRPGDWIFALTNAFRVADKDEPISVTMGVIALETSIEARLSRRDIAYQGDLILLDCITSIPGAAGGAVVLPDGKLIGMVGRVIDSTETNTRLNYAVPNRLLAEFIKPIEGASTAVLAEATEGAEKGDLGIVLFGLGGRNNPAYIDRVRRGSPAAKAKLRSDDLIVSIGGVSVGNVQEYEAAIERLVPQEEVVVVVKRGIEFLRIPMVPEVRK